MAQDIKGEFEEYIEQLIAEISKEIFLEDLKEICDKYQLQLSQYEQLIAKAGASADRIDRFTEEEEADIKGLSQHVNRELSQMNETVQGLMDRYVKVFGDFSSQVSLLNQNERDAFVQTLDKKIVEYEKVMVAQLEKEYEVLFARLLQDFEKVCEKNNVQYMNFEELVKNSREVYTAIVGQQESGLQQMEQVDRTVDRNLKAISDRIQEINKQYAEVFQQFSQKVTALNEKERKEFTQELQQVLERYRNTFGDEIAVKYVAISDKFRTDLAGIYQEYEKQLEEYRRILQEVQKNNLLIQQFTAHNIPELRKLSSTVEDNLKAINLTIAGVTQEYQTIFGAFSDRVMALNEAERQKFLGAMKEIFGQERLSMQEAYRQSQKEWEKKSDELVREMRTCLEAQTKDYQTDRKAFLQSIGQQMTEFSSSVKEEVQAQQTLAQQLQAQQKEMEVLKRELQQAKSRLDENEEAFHIYIEKQENEISQLLDRLQQTQEEAEENQKQVWGKMLDQWNKQGKSLERQRGFGAWKLFMTATNILLVLLVAILFLWLKP